MTKQTQAPKVLILVAVGVLAYCVFGRHEKSHEKSHEKCRIEPVVAIREPATTLNVPPATQEISVLPRASKIPEVELAQEKIDELYRLEECYEHTCEPDLDERSKFFSVGQKIKSSLLSLLSLVKHGEARGIEISKIARDFLKNPDGHVQEAALDLISSQPTYPENLEAILNEVVRASDPELIPQAMLELERYDDPRDQARIHEVFAEALQTGPPFVAVVIAEHLGDFITAQSFWFYSEILKKIDQQTLIHQHLLSTLKEFARKSSAG